MTTTDDTRIVALIERAERDTPFCDCGEPMAAMARNGQIWLYCTTHQNPPGGTTRRFLSAVGSIGHTRRLLVDPA
jgi:hypothetical protein